MLNAFQRKQERLSFSNGDRQVARAFIQVASKMLILLTGYPYDASPTDVRGIGEKANAGKLLFFPRKESIPGIKETSSGEALEPSGRR